MLCRKCKHQSWYHDTAAVSRCRFPQRPGMAPEEPHLRIIASSSANARLAAARAFLERFPPHHEIIIVAATRGAADEFVRTVAPRSACTGSVSWNWRRGRRIPRRGRASRARR
jgi:hypothetical protein